MNCALCFMYMYVWYCTWFIGVYFLHSGNVLGDSNSVIGSTVTAEDDDTGMYYREKLRALRARSGLDKASEVSV